MFFLTNALPRLQMDWIIVLPMLHHNGCDNFSLNLPEQVLYALNNLKL